MAVLVLTNPQIVINSVDLSNRIDQVSLDLSYADVDTTAFGSSNKTRVGGLGDHKFTMEYQQDFAAAEVDATINPLLGLTTAIAVKAVNAATTTVNPAWTFTVLVDQYKAVSGKVGDLVKGSVTWPISGAVTRATS